MFKKKHNIDYITNKYKEMNEYIRQVFQLFIVWFTFFATVNYATMGWLSSEHSNTEIQNSLFTLNIVSWVFILQNFLGCVACIVIGKYFNAWIKKSEDLDSHLRKILSEDSFDEIAKFNPIPHHFYINVVILIFIALFVLLVAWSSYAYYYSPIKDIFVFGF